MEHTVMACQLPNLGSGHVKFESSTRWVSKHRCQVSSLEFGEDVGGRYTVCFWDYIKVFKAKRVDEICYLAKRSLSSKEKNYN